jgi:polyhydroxyalkanoate synthesis regulator phasin
MMDFNFKKKEDDRTADEVKTSYSKVEKSLSKLIGDAMSDYNFVGNMGSCDEDSVRTVTNYTQVMAASKEFGEKYMELNIKMYEKLMLVSDRLEERNSEIKDLQKQVSDLKNLLYKIDSKLNK